MTATAWTPTWVDRDLTVFCAYQRSIAGLSLVVIAREAGDWWWAVQRDRQVLESSFADSAFDAVLAADGAAVASVARTVSTTGYNDLLHLRSYQDTPAGVPPSAIHSASRAALEGRSLITTAGNRARMTPFGEQVLDRLCEDR
jgi:hypothetical protein